MPNDTTARQAQNLRAAGLSLEGVTTKTQITEEITVIGEVDGTIHYIKRQTRPSGGGVIGPICKKCYFNPATGLEVCEIIKCPASTATTEAEVLA